MLTIYDSANDGQFDATAFAAVVTRAETEIYSYLARNYPNLTFPITADPPPAAIKNAVLEFTIVFSRDRKPEYWSSSQNRERKDRMEAAYEMAERYAKAQQIVYDAGAAPANVGGVVRSGDPDDTPPKPKFFSDGTGDF